LFTNVSAFLALLLLSVPAWGAAQLRLELGFGEQFLRKQFAPVRVEVAGLSDALFGQLIVIQDTGTDILNLRSIRYELANGRIVDGVYEGTLPLYDPIYPVEVRLVDANGHEIASESKNVRLAAREEPFPIVVGAVLRFHGTESIVDPAALPREWWAYGAAKTLWIASPSIGQAQWEAIAEWVTAGGSTVIFTGSDFYQLDSPLVRAVLPITAPSLHVAQDGAEHLVGSLRPGAQVMVEREGLPLLIHRAYGAGHIYIVSCRAAELRDGDLVRFEAWVRSARPVASMDQFLKDTVAETRVLRPLYASAPMVGLLCTGVLLLFARTARKHHIAAAVVLLVGVAVISVSSAFYTNWAGRLGFFYHITTRFSVRTDVGIDIALDSIYSIRSLAFSMTQPQGSYPLQTDFRPRAGVDLETAGTIGATLFDVPAGRLFLFRSGSKAKISITWTTLGDSITVTNDSGSETSGALIVLDGRYYRLGSLAMGTQSIQRSALAPVSASAMLASKRTLYRCVSDWLPVQGSDWLVTALDSESEVESGPFAGKERMVDVIVVAGGTS